MTKPIAITLAAVTMLCVAVAYAAGTAVVHRNALNEQIIGVWKAITIDNVLADGRSTHSYGENPTGRLMLDRAGNFSLTLIRSDLPRFASNNRDMGTHEENQAVVQGTISNFGTYSIDESKRLLLMHVEASSFPNWKGTTQKRVIASLSNDELKWHNQAASNGGTAGIVWKRVN